MIVTVTPNPAVDRTLAVAGLRVGAVHGGVPATARAGGKGFNVARVVRTLGEEVVAVGPVGGDHGALFRSLAEEEGIPTRLVRIEAETRVCTIITDRRGGSTVINETGPALADLEWVRLAETVRDLAATASLLSISGSLPGKEAPVRYAELLDAALHQRAEVWVDCSPPLLAMALAAAANVKVNHEEAAGHLEESPPADPPRAWVEEAALRLTEQGAGQAVVTSSAGAAWCTGPATGLWAPTPKVQAVNPTGSGDAFLAGLLVGRHRGLPPGDTLSLALAAGAANAASPIGGVFALSTLTDLLGG